MPAGGPHSLCLSRPQALVAQVCPAWRCRAGDPRWLVRGLPTRSPALVVALQAKMREMLGKAGWGGMQVLGWDSPLNR